MRLYQLTVVIETDEENPAYAPRELIAQLRMAAQTVADNGAPEPGEAAQHLGGGNASVYLTAVEL